MEQPLFYRTLLIGFALLIKRTAYEKTGEQDERFFPGNFEDNDYCTRLILNDYKLVLCRNSFIFHYGNRGFSSLEKPVESYVSSATVNRQRYIDKWHITPADTLVARNDLINQMQVEEKWAPVSCLDIGCACGDTLLEIQNFYPNAKLYGIEMDTHCAAFASHVATVVQGNVETMEIPFDNDFDYIILGILDHLIEPEKLLRRLKAHLSEHGVIIISIPNILHYSAIGDILRGSFEYADAGVLDRTHLRFFTLYNCVMMLQNCGYEIIHLQRVLQYPSEQQTEMKELIDQLIKIPGIVDEEQFLTKRYIFKVRAV